MSYKVHKTCKVLFDSMDYFEQARPARHGRSLTTECRMHAGIPQGELENLNSEQGLNKAESQSNRESLESSNQAAQ